MSVRILIAALLVGLPLSGQEPVPEESSGILQVYDVRDLVKVDGKSDQEIEQATIELRSLLMLAVSERPAIDGTAQGMLVVRGTPDEHDRLRQVLDDLRRERQAQYLMKFVIAWMPIAEGEPDLEGTDIEFVETFDPETRFEGSDVFSAPSVLTLAYQKAVIQTGSTVRLIEGYDRIENVESLPEGVVVPRFSEIHEGLRIETRPIPSLDRKFVTVSLDLKIDALVRPVPVLQGDDGPVHERPKIRTQSLVTTIVVPDGGSFVVHRGVTTPSGERRRLCLMVNVRGLE